MTTMDTFSVHGTERGAGPREELTLATVMGPLTRDFLTWVACKPRTYADAMEAWRRVVRLALRTTCRARSGAYRFEDAVGGGGPDNPHQP
jgi:hypothetical protein